MRLSKQDIYTAAVNDSFDELPAFLQKRLTDWYVGRYQERWGGKHLFHSSTPPDDAIMMQSNDYLGLNGHPEVIRAGQMGLAQQHAGTVMSGIFLPCDAMQYQFEQAMADFLGMEATLITQSGWCANTGLLQSIANEMTPVYIDRMAHTSLWEGAHIAQAHIIPFRHNDIIHLSKLIEKHGRGLIVVDSLYSTLGDLCPLPDIVDIAEKTHCLMVVDESHAIGTQGEKGAGLVALFGLSHRVHFITASLSKAFAGRAGLIAGLRSHIEYIRYTSRPTIFSSALLPHEVAGLMKALELIEQAHLARMVLAQKADYLRRRLAALGYNVTTSQSQIIALESGSEQNTLRLRDALEARGIYGAVFCEPATARNHALIRLTVSNTLTMAQLDRVIQVCAMIRDEVKMQEWSSTQRLERDRAQRKSYSAQDHMTTVDCQLLACATAR